MYQIDEAPGRTVKVKDKEFLFFSGYAYLGLSHVKEFTNLVKAGMDKYGLLYPSARISNSQLYLYQTFEKQLSTLLNTEDTVSYSSGYLAGRAVVDLVAKSRKRVFSAPHVHPAIKCGELLHGEDWKNQLIKIINKSNENDFVLCMDGVNPLTATVANFSFLQEIAADKNLTCIIDDSHGIGLIGAQAEGISYQLPTWDNIEFIISYSLSKAFHLTGGAVSCTKTTADLLRSSPCYSASTAIMPALAYAFIEGQAIYKQQLHKLQRNISDFICIAQEIGGITFYPHLPVFVLNRAWDQKLFDPYQIIISSFAYPIKSSGKINRVVINALHTKQDLFKLSCVLNKLNQSNY